MSMRRGPSSSLLATALCAVAFLLQACTGQNDANVGTEPGGGDAFREAPDFGAVVKEYTEAEGVGPTRAAALEDALRLAVKQVNGVSVQAAEIRIDSSLQMASSVGDFDMTATAFAQAVATESQGLISDMKILDERKEGGAQLVGSSPESFRIRVGANILKFDAGADANRPKVAVAPPRVSASSFNLGGQQISSQALAGDLRKRMIERLGNMNRFAVLDREFSEEIQAELDLISSGSARPQEALRLGQALAADLIVVPVIERMEYTPTVRKLRMSDRELVSFSGGSRISIRVINATTGQIVLASSYASEFPSTEPTTLGASVDGNGALEKSLAEFTTAFAADLMARTFPVAVISANGGDVTLNQGEGIVRTGATYRAVRLGEALTDPQTGQKLGRAEQDFGTVMITQVAPTASYGKLQGATLNEPFRPGLLELREEITAQPSPAVVTDRANSADAQSHPTAMAEDVPELLAPENRDNQQKPKDDRW